MKNGPLFVIGIFAALTVSWAGVVLWPQSQKQIGSLVPYYDDNEGNAFPLRPSGIAAQGELVYRDLGCAACHTQQVRRPGYGDDQARGWGERQSVARDYLYEAHPQLGAMRVGPDLANFGARKPAPNAADLYTLLYRGSATHPGYRFLFETKQVVGERSIHALNDASTAAGYEVVPSNRAQSLVAYLLNLQQGYQFPEATPAPAEAGEGEAKPAAPAPAAKSPAAEVKVDGKTVKTEASPETATSNPPGKRPEQAVPAAAPDENKNLPKK